MIKISKELFFEIKKYNDFNFSFAYNSETQQMERGVGEFYLVCREWAFNNGFEIVVLAYSIKIYKNGYEVYNTNTTLFDLDMFFKACEWILKEIK